MKETGLNVGMKLALSLEHKEKGREVYTSKVLDMVEERLVIDYPVNRTTNKTVFIPVGSTLKASFIGKDQVVYQFTTKIVAKANYRLPALVIEKPEKEDLKRIQRREFVRVETAVDVAVHQENGEFTTVTTDISGGGLSLVVPKKHSVEMDEVVEVWLVLNFSTGKIHYIRTSAQVVFLKERNGVKTASFKFLSIKPKDQQLIISYCFEKQREMRKKELSLAENVDHLN